MSGVSIERFSSSRLNLRNENLAAATGVGENFNGGNFDATSDANFQNCLLLLST